MPNRSHRYTAEQRELALTLIAAGTTLEQVEKQIGPCPETLRLWQKHAAATGTMPKLPVGKARPERGPAAAPAAVPAAAPPVAADEAEAADPRDQAHGLSDEEQAAIRDYKQRHPSMGPAQIRAQLKRFKGWRLSVKAIGRFLVAQGYQLVHVGSRPEGAEPQRFEAPRPNALWQLDFIELRMTGEKLYVLLALDDYSRFLVGHAVADGPESTVATAVLRDAMARHGKPEAVRTDRGGAFTAHREPDDFARVLEAELITHHVGRPYHPEGGGKVESAVGTLRRELWDVEHFASRAEAETRIAAFVEEYNHRRAHLGIDGLTPADRYFGRAAQVLAAINAVSRQRQGLLAQRLAAGAPVEEVLGLVPGAPLEVLRLVLVDGQLELRFCGARVVLGPVTCR